MQPSPSYRAVPLRDITLPTQDDVASNPDSPVANTRAQKLLEKHNRATNSQDTVTKDTGFKRGVPGCTDC